MVRALFICVLLTTGPVAATQTHPHPGTVVINTSLDYTALVDRLLAAISDNGMVIVARASATLGAKSLGVTIPGNQVVMAFHPEFAIRMLKASVAAGIEAPIRFYVTENADGTATLTYRTPSSLFAPYRNHALDTMASELDTIFMRIAEQASGGT